MKRLLAIACLLAAPACFAGSPRPFTGPDLSGVYDCKGDDSHEGKYTGTTTLELVKSQSSGPYAAYRFNLDLPGFGSYPGHGAAKNTDMAIDFANPDPATKGFGAALASFKKNKDGKWSFTKFYYEPEYKGGNYGTEECVQR